MAVVAPANTSPTATQVATMRATTEVSATRNNRSGAVNMSMKTFLPVYPSEAAQLGVCLSNRSWWLQLRGPSAAQQQQLSADDGAFLTATAVPGVRLQRLSQGTGTDRRCPERGRRWRRLAGRPGRSMSGRRHA